MCEIVTMTAIGVTLAGTAVQASAAASRGEAAQATARRAAGMAERQAADAIARADLPASRVRMRAGQFIGVQEAHFAASGVAVGVGSAGDVTQETRILSDQDEQVVRSDAAREAYGFRTKAQAYQQEGEIAKSEAKNAVLASVIGGVGKMAFIGAKGWLDLPKEEAPEEVLRPTETQFNEQGI